MRRSLSIALFVLTFFNQASAYAEWAEITNQVSFTKSTQTLDRINRVIYSLVTIHNTSGRSIPGSIRLRVFDASIPLSAPSPSNADESYIEIPDGLLENEIRVYRVDFQLLKQPLDYSIALQRNVVHVATTGSDTNGDGSEANPFASIQYAIDQANSGDTVLVHDGRYIENINFHGKAITVGSLFIMDGNSEHISDTVIDGNRSDSVVIFDNNEGSNSKLVGLSITNGYASGGTTIQDTSNCGGGVRVFNSTPFLDSLQIFANEATYEGGGLFYDNQIRSNEQLVISKSVIKNNHALYNGGGLRFGSDVRQNAHVDNSSIIGNRSSGRGGGLFLYHIGTIINSIIVGNEASYGGGAYIDWGTFRGQQSIRIINATIVSNFADMDGGGISYIIQGGDHKNSIVWDNFPDNAWRDPRYWDDGIIFNHTLISPLQPGTRNIDTDPLFVTNPDPGPDSMWGTPDDDHGDLRLQANSPLIDQGDSSAITLPTDYQGAERIYGDAVDIGAYEWHPQ